MEHTPKDFSHSTKFVAVLIVVLVSVAIYFGARALGDTTFNLTLTTSPELESGLVAHWTFDSDTIATSTISDRAGGFDATHFSFASSTTYSSSGTSTVVVPSGITRMRVKLWGAGGGSGSGLRSGDCASGLGQGTASGGSSGGGGFVQADLSVTPGESLTLEVGDGGDIQRGGGYTAFLRSSIYLAQAGGGGGGGGAFCSVSFGFALGGIGGAGGGPSGTNGTNGATGGGGGGGTSSTGGAGGSGGGSGTDGADGAANAGGNGGTTGTCGTGTTGCGGTTVDRAGGGGGGRFGGGGGEGDGSGSETGGGGGGGGSSLVTGNNTIETAGSGTTVGNTSDPDKPSGAGSGRSGGSSGSAGSDGAGVIFSLGTSTAQMVAGRIGQGVEITDGSHAKVPGLFGTPTDVTLAAWVNLDEYDSSGSEIISLGDYIALRLSPGSARGFFRDTGTWRPLNDDTVDYAGDGWHHIAFTFDDSGNEQNLYLDGSLATTSSYTGSIDWAAGLGSDTYIGKHANGGETRNFDGVIDDARVYNRALSAREVTRLYGLGGTTRVNKTITSNPALESGLVSHWTFNGSDIDISQVTAEVRDRVGSTHGDWQSHATTTIPGRLGQAIEFDGVDDDIQFGSVTSPSKFSFAFWINSYELNVDGNNNFRRVLTSSVATNFILIEQTGAVSFRVPGVTSANFTSSTGDVPVSEWTHVVVTYDQSDRVIYVNGVQKNSQTIGSGTVNFGSLDVVDAAASYSFKGALDDIRFYSKALSSADAKRLYELGATTRINKAITTNNSLTSDLAGYWSFDGPTVGTSTVDDLSGNGNTGVFFLNAFASSTSYSTSGTSTVVVPSGITTMRAKLWGGGGAGAGASCTSSCPSGDLDAGQVTGGAGGGGGFAQADISVTPGESLTLEVGNGGTTGFTSPDGGGYTALRRGATYLVQAGGGGSGGGAVNTESISSATGGAGGAGGGSSGVAGSSGDNGGAGGAGTTSAGGSGGSGGSGTDGSAGAANAGGNGGSSGTCGTNGTGCGGSGGNRGGGGGGGRFGGGGGEGVGSSGSLGAGGGGGGSSLVTGTNTVETAGSGTTPGNSSDSDRPGSSGNGGNGCFGFGTSCNGETGASGAAVLYSFITSSDVAGATGKIGQGVAFDGTDSYIDAGSGFQNAFTSFTAGMWIRIDDLSSDRNLFFNLNGQGLYPRAWVRSNGSVVLQLKTNGVTQSHETGAGDITSGDWYHLAFTFNGGDNSSDIYINGVSESSTTFGAGTLDGSTSGNLFVGYDSNLSYYFSGVLDDLRVYDRPLSNAEIARLYELGS